MIYRFDNIKKGILGDTPVADTFESNLFVYGLHLLEDSDMMIRKHLLSMYDESKVVTEGFIKKIDLKALCKKIIEFFLKTLKDIYGRLKGLVLELLNNDRTIAKYKDQLRHMPDSFDISKYTDIQFHNYSYFEADIPDPNLYLKFSQNSEDSISELQKIAKIESKQEIIAAIMKLEEAIDIQTDSMFFNEIRGSIIGSGKDLHGIIVTAETYPEYLYSLFRNGESMAHIGKMTITKNQVALSCDRFLNSKAGLDTKYLRFEESKKLIRFATELYEIEVLRKLRILYDKHFVSKNELDTYLNSKRLPEEILFEVLKKNNLDINCPIFYPTKSDMPKVG